MLRRAPEEKDEKNQRTKSNKRSLTIAMSSRLREVFCVRILQCCSHRFSFSLSRHLILFAIAISYCLYHSMFIHCNGEYCSSLSSILSMMIHPIAPNNHIAHCIVKSIRSILPFSTYHPCNFFPVGVMLFYILPLPFAQ